ncbi:hypothetical protein UFOVP1064_36 [uncultured Caudovirales phage]|uniref:Uncharacterized protein n=1 Tax=uncultured Caudovirales phage TaxID=2100421 RepID=A0A6J5PJJ7_9CAUD|nr:hypothetical protein UFOVP659_39 [uncultured Caudovirales phage]CAB4169338.1 hypothetical protein UFOVP885_18 [uncultured Caudovirales phage]CAB4181459.1 hypothetical protein UFOVP1064_36 [uncultured Caudovirales phage]CAB4190007.1 hypothetical protein UFOVP1197_27 [uncultured Caudovirales phage]CAB4196158.1 hypothetical protein UFOVP1294_63 [uncultured Caudovirales phage]|tara:strand:- start:2083 stop:3006 length:924 start_codon:yes stop_codon:yes gene_type:complete
MSEMTLFGGNSLVNSDLLKSLQDMNTNLAGSVGGGGNRISIRGMRFRQYAGGEQVAVSKDDAMNIVILNAARISRTYFAGKYDPDNPTPPACWSTDTQVPSPEVPAEQRMSDKCSTCPMNIKGSGQGDSRACRYNQRLAVAIEGELDKVYQLQLPATSIFGEAKGSQMGMQAYARYLQAHNTPAIAVVTQMSFDTNAETPKLFFKPVRPLTEPELRVAVGAKDSAEAIKAITLTVTQTDGVQKAAPKGSKPYNPYKENIEVEEAPKPKPKAKAEPEFEEPVVASKKAAPKAQAADNDLASIVDEWDD